MLLNNIQRLFSQAFRFFFDFRFILTEYLFLFNQHRLPYRFNNYFTKSCIFVNKKIQHNFYCSSKVGMGNVRPAGRIRPAE